MKYNNGSFQWEHGEEMVGHNEWHKYLGPCHHCGSPCFDYGGGWRCLNPNCFYSYTNPMSDVGAAPVWWNAGINVIKDGDVWMAHGIDFINIQESHVGFGSTPKEAVGKYFSLLTNEAEDEGCVDKQVGIVDDKTMVSPMKNRKL